jgi:hypothetical protein
MQGAALIFCQIVAPIVKYQMDDRTLRQGCRLVENEPAFLYPRTQTAHVGYCTG